MANQKIEIHDPDYSIDPPDSVLGFPSGQHLFEHDDGSTYFLGRGKKTRPDIMFVSPCPLEEEMPNAWSPGMLLKGGPGALIDHAAKQAGIPMAENYYTTLCKYPLPRGKRLTPSAQDIKRCALLFEKELRQRRPRVVVCLGKTVFDYFFDVKLEERDVLGGWFQPPAHQVTTTDGQYQCFRDFDLFVTRPIHLTVSKPETLESIYFDLLEVRQHLELGDQSKDEVEEDYRLLRTQDEVCEWCTRMHAEGHRLFSVDCEWAGEDHLCGDLRSVQFCWRPGSAVLIEFFDEHGERFMTPEERDVAVAALAGLMNQPSVRFIGHNFSADYPWLKHHLGIDPFGRCAFDTMYAMHTVDEAYDLKLERLSIRFTSLGRYDIPLTLWKKRNAKLMTDKGYGAIPSEILFPYGCKDVDVPMRAYPMLTRLLFLDGTLPYFVGHKLPFVTDGFAHMSGGGIPLDKDDAVTVRQQYTLANALMLEVFKRRVRETADEFLLGLLGDAVGGVAAQQFLTRLRDGSLHIDDLKHALPPRTFSENYKKLLHWQDAQDFNTNSAPQKRCWLFDFKGLRPIKSTPSDDGPSISWDKIEGLPPGQRKQYTPSTDKDVLQIYAEHDDDVQLLVEQLAVYQVIKSFLRSETKGLEAHIRADGCVHTSFLMTETGRPRSIRPNILNVPAYLGKRVEKGFSHAVALLKEVFGEDDIDLAYEKYLESFSEEERAEMPKVFSKPVPVRWCFKAPPGWCFVDADYATAEVFALAYLANDEALIATLTAPDPQFVQLAGGGVARVAYVPGVTQFSEEEWDPGLLHSLEDLGDRVVRDDAGNPVHPKRDVHWELVENVALKNQPRERLVKAVHRNGIGKRGNFSTPYGASPALLERMVEIDTGVKPEPGTGDRIIEAYAATKPRAVEYLEELATLPDTVGYYASPSGFKRHFKNHKGVSGVSAWERGRSLKGQEREAKNIAFQEIVGATLMRAINGLVRAFREESMRAWVCTPLYDAVYCVCPIEERERVQELMQYHMSDNNVWDLPGGRLKFNLEFDVTKRWSTAASADEKKELRLDATD